MLFERLLVQNFIAMPAPVFRREVALGLGGLDESLWYTADWDLWLRLAAAAQCRFIDAPLAAFRIHPESQTVLRSREDMRGQMAAVLERHLGRHTPRRIRRVACFSLEVNAGLATAIGSGPVPWRLLAGFVALGPAGWVRYVRYSRILERVLCRLHMRMRRVADYAGVARLM
jgi:hypothetical protein